MCGRFTLTVRPDDIKRRFRIDDADHARMEELPRYNIAPTQRVPIVIQQEKKRKLVPMRWGLIPHWAKDSSFGSRLINARSETVSQKPAFRRAFQRARCLVPADGFFEWKKSESGNKEPMRITMKHGTLFAFAGLWEKWMDATGNAVYSFTILTTHPNEKMRRLHHRMPVILKESDEWIWLDPTIHDPGVLHSLLSPCESEDIEMYPVSTVVNSPKNDGPECIRPLAL